MVVGRSEGLDQRDTDLATRGLLSPLVRDCVIIGSGRSGTSMMAGLFADAGYFMGDDVRPPDAGNSRGYFESQEVNRINEALLDQVVRLRPTDRVRRRIYRRRPRRGQRWVTRPDRRDYSLSVSPEIGLRMRRQAQSPFCLKDPRFAWTLPAWREYLDGALFVCMFRHPTETVDSIVNIGQIHTGLRDYVMRRRELLRVWRDMYVSAVRWADESPEDWIFIDYDRILEDSAPVAELAHRADAPLRAQLIDASMRSMSRERDAVPPLCRRVYGAIQQRSVAAVSPGSLA